MTKSPGQMHYQREDQENAAHQNEAACQKQEATKKAQPIGKGHAQVVAIWPTDTRRAHKKASNAVSVSRHHDWSSPPICERQSGKTGCDRPSPAKRSYVVRTTS